MTLHSFDEWGVTQVDVRRLTYAWTITNFSFCDQETGEIIESPVFSTGDDDEHKWQLHLYPKGYNRNYSDYLTLFLKHVSGNKVKVMFNLALLSGYNKIANVKSLPYTFGPSATRNGYYQFIESSSIYNKAYALLPDDRLTMIVDIFMNVRLVNISGHCTVKSSKVSEEAHYDNFAKLLDDKLFSDVLLLAGDDVFEAHKAILASVSPVLKEELRKSVNNDTKSILHIPYTDAETFKEVLRFIYSGKVENIKNVAKELLIVADRFEIQQLKSLCEEVLCQNLNTENAVDTLYVAENYKAESLREQASNFIVAHASEVTSSIGFKTMEVLHPHPMLRIFRSLTNATQT
ncbi:speckle-type POZ protein B-like [Nasonia vitripennis]|uniref:Roadkill n=1 Tax=Nasonia vitripennis TaxID=7425 RepID=A0A7M7HDD3_NASVI|nr:speckle-type POZ protein B-like [Nasonia vitripennis]